MKTPTKDPKGRTDLKSSRTAQLKVLTLVTCIAGLSMGNQSCQSTSTTAARILKMDIDVGTLNAQTVTLPDGEVVDFKYVVNSLFYQEVMKNDHFVINTAINTSATSSTASSSTSPSQVVSVSDSGSDASVSAVNDGTLLQRYGFIKSATATSNSVTTFDAQGVHTESTINGAKNGDIQASDSTSVGSVNDPNSCLYDLPQASMGGEVNSFGVTGGGGVSVGFSSSGASTTTAAGLGATVQYTAATLEMGFNTVDPLTSNVITATQGVSVQSKIAASVAFPAGGVPLGLNFFYNTPIASAISSAMDKGLAAMVTKYTTMLTTTGNWNDVWESRVVYDPQVSDQDTTVAIRGGYRAGVQVGDQFSVTNLHYMWAGATCNSLLKYKVPMSSSPIAVIKVIAVGDNVSIAQVVSYSGDTKIESGAQVKVSALYVAPTASPTPATK